MCFIDKMRRGKRGEMWDGWVWVLKSVYKGSGVGLRVADAKLWTRERKRAHESCPRSYACPPESVYIKNNWVGRTNSNLDIPLHQYTLEFSVLGLHCLGVVLPKIRTVPLQLSQSPKNVVQSLDEICLMMVIPDSAEITARHGTYLVKTIILERTPLGPDKEQARLENFITVAPPVSPAFDRLGDIRVTSESTPPEVGGRGGDLVNHDKRLAVMYGNRSIRYTICNSLSTTL